MRIDPYAIPPEKILECLRFENPWWKTQAIDFLLNDRNRFETSGTHRK
jgi:hypothetical protein